MAAEQAGFPAAQRRNRKRKKAIISRVKEQVEFYFGDMNLREGFLRAQIDQSVDGFVPIKLVASFGRVKAITLDVSVVTSAIRGSDLLEVSADGQKVRRSTPLADPQDIDERTVYVEDLPPDCSIDSMKKDFSKCGTVEYVRLPRHWNSNDLKGYALVIFSQPDEALEALKMFDNFESGLEPLFPPKATTITLQTSGMSSTVEGGDCEGRGGDVVAGIEEQSGTSSRKRRHDNGESVTIDDDGEPSDAKDDSKPSETKDDSKPSVKEGPPQAKVKKGDRSHVGEREGKSAKASKRSRSQRKKKPKDSKFSYKVLHQLEWNRLKKVYLQVQKEEMSKAKKLLAVFRTPDPDPPLNTARAPAVAADGGEEMCSRHKRGADKIFKRLEETAFLKQSL